MALYCAARLSNPGRMALIWRVSHITLIRQNVYCTYLEFYVPKDGSVNVFLLKEYRNILLLQLSDVFETVQCVSSKPADGLRDHMINATRHTLVDHAIELFALFGVGSRDAVIREDAR